MSDIPKYHSLNLETVMSERFSRYAKSIIQQRAIPDVRDGLKPVQRRILYAMWLDGNTFSKPYRKSAKAVGNVMGNFHPHGDSSIYGALIFMSQQWKMREPLIDLHGNNGSIDDDPPAAMRYTEARTNKITNEMMRGINEGTVDWALNFDDTKYEPVVLPARFPNLLVNGSTGISEGYATTIPPHNLNEVIDALIYLQNHPEATLDDIMQFIKGPDFPTGGIIQGLSNLKQAYTTGRGKIIIRSRSKIKHLKGKKTEIYITEIPYGVNKLRLVKSIDSIRLNHRVNGIEKVQDQSGRQGLGIAIILKRDADVKGILNYLYKNTDLQIAYHLNDVVIDRMQPKRLSLKEMLVEYLQYQRRIVYNQIHYRLGLTKHHQELVKGYLKALSMITTVIHVIRSSKSRWDASNTLQKKYHFTQRQANFVVALRLYRLTNTDASALRAKNRVLTLKQHYYQSILSDPIKLDFVLRHDFLEIKKKYGTPRKTSIQDKIQKIHVARKVVIPKEDMMVQISHDGFMKRSSIRSYSASTKNGLTHNDYPIFLQHLNTRNYLFMFTNLGHLIFRPVYKIKNVKWKDVGQHISQDIGLAPNEHIISVQSFQKSKNNGTFLIETNDGYIKQTKVMDLEPKSNYMKHASKFINLKGTKERVINVQYIPSQLKCCFVLLLSSNGYGIKMPLSQVPVNGKNAHGVKSINLENGDDVSNILLVFNDEILGILTRQDYYNQIPVNDINVSKRNRRGMKLLNGMKYHKYSIADAKILNPNLSRDLTVRTLREQTYDVKPAKYGIGKPRDVGTKLIRHHNLGIPVHMSY